MKLRCTSIEDTKEHNCLDENAVYGAYFEGTLANGIGYAGTITYKATFDNPVHLFEVGRTYSNEEIDNIVNKLN